MTPTVLILSSLYDFSADLACIQLNEKGVEFLRLNREHLQNYRLTLNPQLPHLTVRMNGSTYHVGQNLKAVWFRQPVFLRNTPSEPLSTSQQLERSQWTAFLRALSVFDQAAWMNYPAKTYLAECKPYQLHVAARCGFSVPLTCASNDAFAIRNQFPNSAIVKSLDTVLLREGDDCLFTYTTLNQTSEISEEATHDAPLLAQELLTEKTDIRVTLIGDRIFAVKILVNGRGIEGDWRVVPRDDVQYENLELSPQLRRKCHGLAEALGLSYAAIDLIETPDRTYFIEVNPTGEWGWLDAETRPIAATLAEWLQNPTFNDSAFK